MIPTWPEQVNEDTVCEGVCAVGDAREELGPPERGDLQRHDGHQRKIDEPDQTGGSEVEKKLEPLLFPQKKLKLISKYQL